MTTRQASNRYGLPSVLDPMYAAEKAFLDDSLDVPDIVTFVTSPLLLNRPNLYPRQATLLKILFLEIENLTEYDLGVIREWERTYRDTADEAGEGHEGIVPGVVERMQILRICPCGHDRGLHQLGLQLPLDEDLRYGGTPKWGRFKSTPCGERDCICPGYRGRKWFREFVSVIGRRGSKGHLGALAVAYILWHFIEMGNPQDRFGVDQDKRLSCIVFGGKKEQAKANQWRDVNNIILGAPCFIPFISRPLGESLTINCWNDFRINALRRDDGVFTDQDAATFEVIPRESTQIAARGPASFALVFDEAAHVVKGVSNIPAEDVYESATPSLDQFGVDGFIYIPSSPWQRIGLFYDKYLQAIELDEDGQPVYPEMVMIQLPSWTIYEDWEKAHVLETRPGGPTFRELRGSIQTYDHQMQQLERANPDTFAVERRSHFANVIDAYLNENKIAAMWQPWPTDDDVLTFQTEGMLHMEYRAHGDPSKSGARFGFAIAHKLRPEGSEFPHVVFDVITHWDPADYPDHEVSYTDIEVDIKDYLDAFMPSYLSFDQFNSVGTIQNLRRYVNRRNYPKRVTVYERSATGPLNWSTYETFKTALGLGVVHAPFYEIANQELLFLQDLGGKVDHPTAGPVQTKDVADCMAIVTYELIGDEIMAFIGQSLTDLELRASHPGGFDAYKDQREEVHEQLSRLSQSRRPSGGDPSRGRRL